MRILTEEEFAAIENSWGELRDHTSVVAHVDGAYYRHDIVCYDENIVLSRFPTEFESGVDEVFYAKAGDFGAPDQHILFDSKEEAGAYLGVLAVNWI